MPKKMGLNSKSLEARERKDAAKKASQDRAVKEAEDRFWNDPHKCLDRKQQKRDEVERKRAEYLRRRAEARALLDEEMNAVTTHGKHSSTKMSRMLILEELDKKHALDAIASASKPLSGRIVVQEQILEENLNRSMADLNLATNIDEALAVLSINDDEDDRHPEKRMRAAYRSFECANLPRIKSENPSLRMSQWKQLLMKEWNKSPENPFNHPY